MNNDLQSTVVTSIFNAGRQITDRLSFLQNSFDTVVNGTSALLGSFMKGTSVVGIQTTEIPNMRQAIRDYCDKINSHLDTIDTKVDTNIAFKGDYAVAVREYADAIKKVCKSLTSNLLAFSDQLYEIEKQYHSSDDALKSNISKSSSTLSSNATEYEEKYK